MSAASCTSKNFNAAGADLDGRHGEAHREETHVIPLVIQAALGQRPGFKLYGDAWDTPDGSCIRDFVSVMDLAEAHLLALQKVRPGEMQRYNLGSGSGTSVRELLVAAAEITGRPVPTQVEAPRLPPHRHRREEVGRLRDVDSEDVPIRIGAERDRPALAVCGATENGRLVLGPLGLVQPAELELRQRGPFLPDERLVLGGLDRIRDG